MPRPLFSFLLTLGLLVIFTGPVLAQDPEPTAVPTLTPTPAYQMVVTLTSGNELMLSRTVTYGDIAVVLSVCALILVILFAIFYLVPRSRAKS
jgi:hypothetical protein